MVPSSHLQSDPAVAPSCPVNSDPTSKVLWLHSVPTRLCNISTVWIGLNLPGLKATNPSVEKKTSLLVPPRTPCSYTADYDVLDLNRAVIFTLPTTASPLLPLYSVYRHHADQATGSPELSQETWVVGRETLKKMITSIYLVLVGVARECQGRNVGVRRQPVDLVLSFHYVGPGY